ncbi:MAG TPA: type II toxin-antitoxin system Phd/YefM family antitoxin [bacterium]|nr:type II toxin-antitoxin system Phd/YefM family antitoxin [bacterium]HPN42448.1 type II toxin-antitoxin system Phd/YefM family antitoxin [bacterium]
MKASESVKPISYLKAHASEIVRDIANNQKTLIITQNGEAKAVLQDIKIFEETQESLALLKILAISAKNLKDGNYKELSQSFNDVRTTVKPDEQE